MLALVNKARRLFYQATFFVFFPATTETWGISSRFRGDSHKWFISFTIILEKAIESTTSAYCTDASR